MICFARHHFCLLLVALGFAGLTSIKSNAQAPSSIDGQAVILTITSGSYPFATSGSYRFLASATGDGTYVVIGTSGSVQDSYGTFTYSHTATTGTVSFNDSVIGVPAVSVLTFLTGSSGTFITTIPSVPGAFQSGNFSAYTGQAPSSVQGWTFQLQIATGVAPFAASGSPQIIAAVSGNTYQIIGGPGVSNSSGTYVYTTFPSISSASTSLTLDDHMSGSNYSQTLSWNTSTSGAYVVRNVASGGFQAGTFVGTPPVTVTPSAGANGSISPNTAQLINSGGSGSFTALANPGFAVYQWLLNGAAVQTGGNSYTASNITANSTVQVTFKSAPAITSVASSIFTIGQTNSFTVTATGYPAPTFTATGLPSWANLNSTTGVLSGTPSNATGAPFTINFSAANGTLPNASQVFTLKVEPPENLGQWEAANSFAVADGFTADEILPTSTAFNDGVPNLLKYLCDIAPSSPMGSSGRAALPVAGVTTIGQSQYLTLTYRQYALKSGIAVSVQASPDLKAWTTLTQTTTNPPANMTNYTLLQMGTDPNTSDPIMQVLAPMNGTTQFIRLNVSSP